MSLVLFCFLKFTLLKTEVSIYYFCFTSGAGKRNFLTLVVPLAIVSLWLLLLGGCVCVWAFLIIGTFTVCFTLGVTLIWMALNGFQSSELLLVFP